MKKRPLQLSDLPAAAREQATRQVSRQLAQGTEPIPQPVPKPDMQRVNAAVARQEMREAIRSRPPSSAAPDPARTETIHRVERWEPESNSWQFHCTAPRMSAEDAAGIALKLNAGCRRDAFRAVRVVRAVLVEELSPSEKIALAPNPLHPLVPALLRWMEREYLTHGQAATRLKITDVHLGQWLNGTRRPTPAEVTRVLELVG